MENTKNLIRPFKVTIATNFYYAAVVLDATRTLILFLLNDPSMSDGLVVSIKLTFYGVMLFFTYEAATGKKWARIALLIIFIIGFKIFEKTIFSTFLEPSFSGVIDVLELLLKAIALYLFFQNDSSKWLTKVSHMKTITTLAASEPALGTTLPINMTTQDTAPPKHQLEQCPKCRCKITLGAKLCPYCGSNFGLEIKKPILQPKTDGFIQPSVVINFVMAKFGLLMLLIGMAVALDPHDNADAKAWAYGCIFGMLIVIFSALTLRPHWMLLITLGAVALGFSSCTTNFHWHGG